MTEQDVQTALAYLKGLLKGGLTIDAAVRLTAEYMKAIVMARAVADKKEPWQE